MFGLFDFGSSADTLITIAGKSYDYSNPADKLQIMGMTAGLGIAVVFSVIIIIFVVLNIFNLIYYMKHGKKDKIAKPQNTEKPAAAINNKTDDGAIVAAITAALTEYLSQGGTKEAPKFRVVSFKRK